MARRPAGDVCSPEGGAAHGVLVGRAEPARVVPRRDPSQLCGLRRMAMRSRSSGWRCARGRRAGGAAPGGGGGGGGRGQRASERASVVRARESRGAAELVGQRETQTQHSILDGDQRLGVVGGAASRGGCGGPASRGGCGGPASRGGCGDERGGRDDDESTQVAPPKRRRRASRLCRERELGAGARRGESAARAGGAGGGG